MASQEPSGMLASFWRRIAPKLSLRMSRESFTISNGVTTLTLPTSCYAEPAPRGLKVLAVGEVPNPSPGQIRFDLFGTLPPGVEFASTLEAFLKHAIQRVLPKHAMIRPSVTVTGLAALGMDQSEDKMGVLLQALGKAGARLVELPERAGG